MKPPIFLTREQIEKAYRDYREADKIARRDWDLYRFTEYLDEHEADKENFRILLNRIERLEAENQRLRRSGIAVEGDDE